MVDEHAAQRAGARPQHADAFHRGDLTHVREPFLALDDRPVDELAVGIERPEIGLLACTPARSCPRYSGAMPTSSGRVPPFDLKRIAAMPGLHFVGALGLDEHDAAHAEVQLAADVVHRLREVRRDLLRLDDQRMLESAWRFSAVAGFSALMNSVNAGDRASTPPSIVPLNRKSLFWYASASFASSPRLRRRRIGRRRAAAAARIARRVDAEHRLVLLEQLDHRIQPLTMGRLR